MQMKSIILHGSPRKNGNSDTLAKYFIDGFISSGDNESLDFYINDLNISPCQGCLSCKTALNHNCAIKDDMQQIKSAFIEANIIVFATPMYWGYMTSQLKKVMDRMEALTWEHFKGKTFVVLITYHHHCESAVAFFKRITPFFGIELHVITCCTLDKESHEDLSILNYKEKLKESYNLGKELGKND
jgi:multimeric flavodoxin WrbA